MPRNQAVNLHVGCFALTVSKHHNALFAGDPQLYCDERERLGVWLADGRYATRAVATRHTEVLPDGLYEYAAAKKPKTVRSKPAGIMAHHKRPAYSRILPPAMPLVRPRRPHSLWQRARGAADSGSSDLASSSSDATPSPPDASPRQQPDAAGEEGDDGVVAEAEGLHLSSTNSTGYTGVSKDTASGRFRAPRVHLGSFDTAVQAVAAVARWRRRPSAQ
mmetsp:Transcript_6972/g.20675  ORF Transcript_6972/g.20675 Transcript_6972/m.20675 type:complete len:219 (-) Transcript_6972:2-658(-)